MWRLRRLFLDTKLFFKRIFWRLKFGFDITDTWNLDYSLAEWLARRVRHLLENTNGHPYDLTKKEWERYLTTIAKNTERFLRCGDGKISVSIEEECKIYENYKIAMQMFTDRLHDMWD